MKNEHRCQECDNFVTEDVICDICHKSCSKQVTMAGHKNIVNGELTLCGCYGSKYDMQILQCDMCEECFDKVKNFIELIGGTIRTKDVGWD